MIVRAYRAPIRNVVADWLAFGIADRPAESPPAIVDSPLAGPVARALASGDLPAGVGDATPILGVEGLEARAVLAFGLGPRDAFDAGAAFAAGTAVAKRLAGKPRDRVAVVVPADCRTKATASALVEGLIVGTQGPDLRKAEKSRHPFGELHLILHPGHPLDEVELEEAARRGEVVGLAINRARTWVNTPPAEKAPRALAARIAEAATAAGLGVTVWDRDRLEVERFGGVTGVAAGSDEPPAMVRLEHRGGGDRPAIVLVGKGVTFDSGGLSLKPSTSMEDMKSDMAGAATVASVLLATAALRLPVNVVGLFALVENMTGGRALKLGDVLTHRNGKTVEVLNTDAEGRLILADLLAYAAEAKPAKLIDLATLTGACLVALGTKVAGLFSNDDPLADEVRAACRATGERAWRLPLDDDFRDALKSPVADLKNIGGKWGGAITAAKFLEQFVDEVPWVHLDIAGPGWSDSDGSTRDVGGTGCFVRTLIRLLEDQRSVETR